MDALIERRESGPAWMDKTSDEYGAEERETQAARESLHQQLGKAIATGDAGHLCQFSKTTDWDAVKAQPVDMRSVGFLPKRAQTLAEVLTEAINGYPEREAMLVQLMLNASTSTDPVIATQARSLIDTLSSAWVEASV